MKYFIEYDIKSITLQGDNLIIEYESSQTETKPVNKLSQELQQVKSYLGKIGKSKLSLSDLKQGSSTGNGGSSKKYWLWIGIGIVSLLLAGIIIYLLLRGKKKENNARTRHKFG